MDESTLELQTHLPAGFRLKSADGALHLQRADGAGLSIDFVNGQAARRSVETGRARQPLAKAAGLATMTRRLGHMPAIVDATGGLGQDAWFLAALGAPVTIIERHPVLHALLNDALKRALVAPASADIARRLTLVADDAVDWLKRHEPTPIVHLDPMYPERRQKADSRKGAQFLHALAGPDSGNEYLLKAALAHASARVFVKRPKGAEAIVGDAEFTGQRSTVTAPNTRYDIYHLQG